MQRIEWCGRKDYYKAIQSALDKGGKIEIGKGFFTVSGTLRIKSYTTLVLDPETEIFTADYSKKSRYDFLIANADPENGNENITISGGIWNGNCLYNKRGDLFGGGYTGAMMNFFNVRNLTIENAVLKDPECYYVRMCRVNGFTVKNILFDSRNIRPNQDGIHLAGFCYNGFISGLKGSEGSPNDDFVALNADDCLTRLQNLDVLCGEIENITIENLESPYCHSFIRLLSVNSSIRNVRVTDLKGCCKAFAVNMDAARYCKRGTRLLSVFDKRYFTGCGNVENVFIENVEVYSVKKQKALILIETNVKNFVLKNFITASLYNNTPALSVGYNAPCRVGFISADGKRSELCKGKYKRVKLPPSRYEEINISLI